MNAYLEVDREQLAQFVGALFTHATEGNRVSLRTFIDEKGDHPPGPRRDVLLKSAGFGPLVDEAAALAARAANAARPFVFCPPICTFNPTTTTANAEDVMEGLVLSVESDKAPDAARLRLSHLIGPATVVAASGGEWVDPATGEVQAKQHIHWRLSEPATGGDLAKLYEARDLATALVGADSSNKAIVHPIRWPGTWHRKGQPKLARIVSLNAAAEIDIDEALELLREAAGSHGSGAPPYHSTRGAGGFRLDTGSLRADDDADVAAALEVIPNDDLSWDEWNYVGLAAWGATGGGEAGQAAFHAWSSKSGKYDSNATETRWRHYGKSPPTKVGFGTLVYMARKVVSGATGYSWLDFNSAAPVWEPPSRKAGGAGFSWGGNKTGEKPGGTKTDEPPPGAEQTESNTDAKGLSATPFVWKDPLSVPPRRWLYGRHLLRGQVAVTVAPGGVGKSSLTIVEDLAMVTGRDLLGEWVAGELRVWLFNLEDPREELERRIIAAMLHHGIAPDAIGDRLFVDSGRERGLCTAIQTRNGLMIVRPEIDALIAEIKAKRIDVLTIDPFVSSHQAGENDNNAIDLIAKEWARVAHACDCAIELVHHTRKTNGAEASTEDGRGASALLAAARSGRVLNKMTDDLKAEAGIQNDQATYFAVVRDKANLAPCGKRVWRRIAPVDLGQGDSVGVAEAWQWPDMFEGFTAQDLLKVQRAIDGKHPRYSDQSGDEWAGNIVAEVLGLNPAVDRKRIKKMIDEWITSGALVKGAKPGPIRKPVPTVEVGIWATE